MDRLKRIHRMEGHGRTCTPYDLIHGYLKGADEFQVKQPVSSRGNHALAE